MKMVGATDPTIEFTWINPPSSNGGEKSDFLILSFPVNPELPFSQILKEVYIKTTEIAKEADGNCKTVENHWELTYLTGLQFIRSDTLLTREEYQLPIKFFLNGDKISLNTSHCGKLVVSVLDKDGNPACIVSVDIGKDTLADLQQLIFEETGIFPDYIYNTSKLFVYPGREDIGNKITNLPQVIYNQFLEVKMKRKEYEEEIGVYLKMAENPSWFIYFLDSTLSYEETLEELVEKFKIPSEQLSIYTCGLRGIEDEENPPHEKTLKELGITDFSHLEIRRGGDSSAESTGGLHRRGIKSDSLPFADLSAKIEDLPTGKKSYEKPRIGLNLQGECIHSGCKRYDEKTPLLIQWDLPTFNLLKDATKVNCPKCCTSMKIVAPMFYLTQWMFYGRRNKTNTETGEIEQEYMTCEWQTADDPHSAQGFNPVDLPDFQVGMTEWTLLLIKTKNIRKKKKEPRRPKREGFDVTAGFKAKLPYLADIFVSGHWFKIY